VDGITSWSNLIRNVLLKSQTPDFSMLAIVETLLRSDLKLLKYDFFLVRDPKRFHLFFYFPNSWSLDNVSVPWIKKEMQI